MAMSSVTPQQLFSMKWEDSMGHFAQQILLKGFGRPWQQYAAHGAVLAANFGGFFAVFRRDFLRLLLGRGGGATEEERQREQRARRSLAALLFAKFLVWQHLAEAIGCRQGPLAGYFGLPNNWRYRLSLGTIKHPLLPFLGRRRNIVDLIVHVLFFATGAAFLGSGKYELKYIRALCACDVWIFLSDMTQFYASTGHAYFSMLFSACFPEEGGQLAGIQMALLIQWFFSGVGKIGPWFGYVNGPFMLQSRLLAGQQWLFRLLVKSPTDLSPTRFGAILAHACASVEYLAPLALMIPRRRRPALPAPDASASGCASATSADTPPERAEVAVYGKYDRYAKAGVWLGLVGIVGMHGYILTMPAPFDVYSWNLSFGLSGIYLFYYAKFGFDHGSAARMNRGLAAYLLGEIAMCWYGQFFPDQVGFYLSHRYWAGNWVQTLFFVKNTDAARAKLGLVKTFPQDPKVWQSLERFNWKTQVGNMAYLWLANLNMKAAVGLVMKAVQLVGGPGAEFSHYFPVGLTQLCCGEFRDSLYAVPVLPTIQEQVGFEAGECFMVRLGAFGMAQETATWGIYDLKDGLVKSGVLTLSALSRMNSHPSQSIGAFD